MFRYLGRYLLITLQPWASNSSETGEKLASENDCEAIFMLKNMFLDGFSRKSRYFCGVLVFLKDCKYEFT